MNRLSNEELMVIRERAEKATEGPWYREYGDVKTKGLQERKYGFDEVIAEMYYEDSDADFIAHAREDIPKLLAEIERLRSGLEALDKDISACLAYKLPFELIEISGYINDILYGGDDE